MRKTFAKLPLALILIILVALFLRFYKFDLIEFKGDEVHYLWTAKNVIENHQLPLLGIRASIGVYNPAIFDYFIILFSFLSRSPLFITAIIAFINVLAIFLCYFFLKRYFSERIAIIACLLFATSPYAVIYSRKLWPQNILPIFVISFMFCFYKLVFERNQKYIVWSIVLLAFFAQIHMSGLFFSPFVILIYFFSRELRRGKLLFFAGLGLAVVTFLPYTYYELTHNFENLHAFLEYAKGTGKLSFDAIKFSINTVTTSGFEYYLGNSYNGFSFANIKFLNFISVLSYLSGFLIIVSKINKKNLFVLLWLLMPITFLLMPKSAIYPHYLIITYPAQWIIISFFFDRAMSNKRFKYISLILLLAIILSHIFFSITFYNYIDDVKKIDGDYGTPLKYKLEELRSANETELKNFLKKSDYSYLYDYYFKEVKNAD